MKRLSLALSACLLLVVSGVCSRTQAQPHIPSPSKPGETLRVATKIISPFVIRDDKNLTGFSIELWTAIARRAGFKTRWVETQNLPALLNTVHSGGADCGVAAISITAERDRAFDFSQPIYDSGLQILVRSDEVQSNSMLANLWSQVSHPPLLTLIGLMFVSTLVMAHLLWLVERKNEDSIVEHPSYRHGMRKALWWSAGTLGAQADEMPRSALGRLVAVMWMFLSIIFVAFFTATITTTLTMQQLRSDINGPGDLPGKRVATVMGSTSEAYLREKHINAHGLPTLDAATALLLDHKVDAVVYDAPVLQYFATNDGKGKAQVVGTVFRKEDYGIVFPANSLARKRINNVLLALKENGTYDALVQKYFGSDDDSGAAGS